SAWSPRWWCSSSWSRGYPPCRAWPRRSAEPVVAAHRQISTGAVAIAAAGGVTVWAAMKGVGVASGFRALISGHTLPPGEDLTVDVQVARAVPGGGGGELPVNNSVAATALGYVGAGHLYRWGGGSPGGWDCSGF